jgi:hypothetical protein
MHHVTVHDYMWNDPWNNLLLVGFEVFTAVTMKRTSTQMIINFVACFLEVLVFNGNLSKMIRFSVELSFRFKNVF